MASREKKVKSYFENTKNYLEDNPVGIQTRAYIIKKLLSDQEFDNLLDVPCGNGLISIALAGQTEKITMVDISVNMVNHAKENTPDNIASKCTYHIGNIFDIELKINSYDCLLAIGILGHVDSPDNFIDHIDSLIKSGGILIIQNTDDAHFKTRIQKKLLGQKKLIQNNSYELNAISHKWLVNKLKSIGYTLQKTYRYETRVPFFVKPDKSAEKQIKNITHFFGIPPYNTMSFLGSKCLYKFEKN